MDKHAREDGLKQVREFSHVASGVGHHVINAFAAVVSNAEVLKLNLNSTVDRESLVTTIIQTALDASVVARRMLDFSRAGTHPGDARFSLAELVEDYVAGRKATRADPRATWTVETTEVPEIRGNPGHLREMLDRLFENALESGSNSDNLTVGARVSVDNRDWVVLEVHDTGAGMSPQVLERAIEPFFTTKPNHVGVGLTIANGVWRRHRGTLSLKSAPGEGTTIRLCVDPRVPNSALSQGAGRLTTVIPPRGSV